MIALLRDWVNVALPEQMYFMAADWLILEAATHALAPSSNDARTLLIKVDLVFLSENGNHTGKCNVDLVVFTLIAGTSYTGSGRYWC